MVEYDPFSPRWREDPYPVYRRLRDESPVHFAPEANVYCVSRYDDVMHVLKSPETFSSRAMFTMLQNQGMEGPPPITRQLLWFVAKFAVRTRMNPFRFPTTRSLIAEDGASHSALRAIVNRGFSPRRVASWEPRVRKVVDACMDGPRTHPRFDLMRDLAIPLPVTIIAEMLGVERERHADFKRWSNTVIQAATGELRSDPFHPESVRAIVELDSYLAGIVRRRRKAPADDLISVLATRQEGEGALTTMEMVQFVMLLLVAGNETTTNLIGNGTRALLDHPDQLDAVVRDPGLVPGLVEEALRYDSPIQILFRTTTCDTEIAGTPIPKGAFVAPLLGSANRDERRFPDPDVFDVGRGPQGHVGFGFGHHFCLGASLARLEARAAFEAIAPELPHLKRVAEPTLVDSFLVRGMRGLELERAA